MAKITLYFPTQAEYDAYWQGEQPGSKYLCIIQDSGVEGLENVLVTTSNNAPNSDGQQQEMGGSTIDIISEQAETIAEQLEEIGTQQAIIDDYENGETVSKTEYDAVVDELNDAEDITDDIKGEPHVDEVRLYKPTTHGTSHYKLDKIDDDKWSVDWQVSPNDGVLWIGEYDAKKNIVTNYGPTSNYVISIDSTVQFDVNSNRFTVNEAVYIVWDSTNKTLTTS